MGELDLNSPSDFPGFLPGWVYDLPPRLETERQEYLKTIHDKMIRAEKDLNWADNRFLPIALAVNHLPEAAFRGQDHRRVTPNHSRPRTHRARTPARHARSLSAHLLIPCTAMTY